MFFGSRRLTLSICACASAVSSSMRLPEQSIKILALLLEKPGEVVLREEIRKKLWPNDTFL